MPIIQLAATYMEKAAIACLPFGTLEAEAGGYKRYSQLFSWHIIQVWRGEAPRTRRGHACVNVDGSMERLCLETTRTQAAKRVSRAQHQQRKPWQKQTPPSRIMNNMVYWRKSGHGRRQ